MFAKTPAEQFETAKKLYELGRQEFAEENSYHSEHSATHGSFTKPLDKTTSKGFAKMQQAKNQIRVLGQQGYKPAEHWQEPSDDNSPGCRIM